MPCPSLTRPKPRAVFLTEALGKNLFPGIFGLLAKLSSMSYRTEVPISLQSACQLFSHSMARGCPHSMAHPPQVESCSFFKPSSPFFPPISVSLPRPSSTFKDSCDYTAPPAIIQDNLPILSFMPLIPSAKTLLRCEVT